MAQATKIGIIGGGWPGLAHLRGCKTAGGFQIAAVADLVPQRRQELAAEAGAATEYSSAEELIADPAIEAVSICLPTHLHLSTARSAMKAGKHVLLETPPTRTAFEASRLNAAAAKSKKVLAMAFQRRFGGAELAAKQVIEKDYIGPPYHVRAGWMRMRGVPIGTGWYTNREQSGGGALMDIGCHMLDIAWHLLGEPNPISAFAVTHRQLTELIPAEVPHDVEDAAFGMIRFEEGKSLELAVSWAINQSPAQNGTTLRVHGTAGAVEVYSPLGPMLYRQFDSRGNAKQAALKQPKVSGHAAMLRHFRDCILGKAEPTVGPRQAITLMQMIEGLYRSAELGRSVHLNRLEATEDEEEGSAL